MAGITGQGTTFNLPNYVGELFQISPEDTPLLSAIGGLTGGEETSSVVHEWQYYDLRDAADNRQRLEGDNAPTAGARVRGTASNVLEIHQEAVEISYTKLAARAQRGAGSTAVRVGGLTIPADELAFQINAELKQIARDVEKTFITGTYARPANNSSPRRTRGLLEAITTNVETLSTGWSGFKGDDLLDLMQSVWESGGLQEGETRTVIVNATGKRALTREFIKQANYRETSRNVGGVNLQTFETDFGRCNIMLNRYMPVDQLVVASLEDLAPVFLRIPGKGHFFVEPLAKVGAAERVQIYGEIGLKYGHEARHGKLVLGEDSSSAQESSPVESSAE